MRFVKMHGAGNDYVYLDGFEHALPENLPDTARKISNRNTGIGSDGLIVVEPTWQADAQMRIWNADGSVAEMCGNGLRCVAKLLYETGHVRNEEIHIATDAGIRVAWPEVQNGRVERVRVSIGEPQLTADHLPNAEELETLQTDSRLHVISAVSMGNPHCVVFTDELSDELVQELGPQIEQHRLFPQRTNVEFVRVLSSTEVQVRVWERGVGETQACGTGACAVAVAGALSGQTDRQVRCFLPGGVLDIDWTDDGDVHLTGPAAEIFRGDWSESTPTIRIANAA
ncbi:diaminopimelate epimerase [Thalassoroseus pseudoceratinae]|uniref:diaminopimelate epimerase n=1 Tax=Thalassoroseus pseudoceratinae TaxID=2713176 RepID=UPI00142119F5|nr:diaminopimelate epimerase [Thalassoroseus pseudoceratinae]